MSLFDQIAQQHYAVPPGGWQTKKIKFLAEVVTSNVDKLSADDEEPVRLCNYTDVYYNDRITPDLPFMEATATSKEIEKFTLRAGQVLITKDSEGWDDIGIPALVTEDTPGVLCGYHLAIFTPEKDKLDGAFLAWLCRADALNDQFKLSANGVTRFGLGQYPMKNAVVGYPPLETQKRIAGFLDEKTAQIDALIARKQALLKRLTEKRQALITRAVTKGLNPDAPMKDSGIDWLGPIPAHWEVSRLDRLNDYRRPIRYGIVLPGPHFDGGIPIIKGGDVRPDRLKRDMLNCTDPEIDAANPRARVIAGDLVYTIRGSFGDVEIVTEELAGCNLTQDTARISPIEGVNRQWLLMALKSSVVRGNLAAGSLGATIKGINIFDLRRALLPTPPPHEQQAIASYLSDATRHLESIRSRVELSVSLLANYRSALITSAVTGQIEGLR